MSGMDPTALDRYITGNYGEDQFTGVCSECGGTDSWFDDFGECAACTASSSDQRRQDRQDDEAAEYELRAAQAELDPRSDEWFRLQVQLRSVVRRLRGMGDV